MAKEIAAGDAVAEYNDGVATGVIYIEGRKFTGATGLGNQPVGVSRDDFLAGKKTLVNIQVFYDAPPVDKPLRVWASGEAHSVRIVAPSTGKFTDQTITAA